MKLTRQQAINAFCRDCIVDNKDVGTWRTQVEGCEMTDCPLYEYRPITTTTRKANIQLIESMGSAKQKEALERKRKVALESFSRN